VQTKNHHVLPIEVDVLDVAGLLVEAAHDLGRSTPREEAWVL
jgi:hypothetical protein